MPGVAKSSRFRYEAGNPAASGNGGFMSTPVSVHRAGIYAILAPGWGDWYAGRPVRGVLLLCGFLACFTWLCWVGATLLLDLTLAPFAREGLVPGARAWAVDPRWQLGVATLGMVWLWHLGVFSAIASARELYRQEGREFERAPWFAVLVSVCAPGAGQAYASPGAGPHTGRVRFGLGLLVAYLLGYLTLIPALQASLGMAAEATKQLEQLGQLGQPQGTSPLHLASVLHNLVMAAKLQAEFSLPWKLHDLLKAYAIADVCACFGVFRAAPAPDGEEFLLEPAPPRPRPAWESSNFARVFGHLALGWLCPGAGQFLQGRERAGWIFFGMNWGLLLSGSILLGLDAISFPRLSLLQDACTLLAIAAGMEACWRMEARTLKR